MLPGQDKSGNDRAGKSRSIFAQHITILMRHYLAAITLVAAFCGRAVAQAPVGMPPPQGSNAPGAQPHVIVYKTKGAYAGLVPVILSPDKTRITSYPAPGDLRSGKPVVLRKGYLLDRRGINENVAFLNLTYAQYAALPEAPPMPELMAMIRDKDPLLRICDCGPRASVAPGQSNPTAASLKKLLNRWINQKLLTKRCPVVYPAAGN